MKKLIFGITTLFLLSSCAQHVKSPLDNRILYDRYEKYISLLNKKETSSAIKMLSKRNITDLSTHSSLNKFTSYFPVLSTINKALTRNAGNLEKTHNNKGCLTVFGFDSSNEPTSINLEYVKEMGEWKLDYVQVIYHGTKDELPKKATCPTRM